MTLSRRGLAGIGAALAGLPAAARAQGGRTVTLVVPYSPGVPPDLIARLVGDSLQRGGLGPIVVDNRPGASGNIGTQTVARATPDGQTLLVSAGTIAMNVSLFRSIPYDPVTSFAPVSLLASIDFALIAHPSAGTSLEALLAAARARPGQLNYGSPGVGTPHHLAMELFKQRTGAQIEHIPYRNSGGAVADLLGGSIAAMLIPVNAAFELSKDGRVRILAMATDSRLPQAPTVPTMAEAGVPDMKVSDWYGMFAPAGTPAETIRMLNERVNAALASPEVSQALAAQPMTIIGGPPERLRDRLATDLRSWATLIRERGITAE